MIAELAGKRGAIGADNATAVHSDVINFPFSGYLLQTVVHLQTRFCVHINMRWQTSLTNINLVAGSSFGHWPERLDRRQHFI